MIPPRFSTLIEMLAYRADHNAQDIAFTFNRHTCSFARLWQDSNRFASYLLTLGISQGDRVIIAIPNSIEFFFAFYGTQLAGGIAVPLFPGSGPDRIFSIAALCEATYIVAPNTVPENQIEKLKISGSNLGFQVVTESESTEQIPIQNFPDILPSDIAFIQYTSGSTGNPKGVLLSHKNLITNILQMIAGMKITNKDIFVSWLPIYHDMGLILKTMVPFYLAAQVHLLPTDLRDVHPWLHTIQMHRATFTAAPDFAYRLCLRYVDPAKYDLSSLRVALNASEPVRAKTAQEFEAAFNLKNVMVAGYGLAEATVGVSMSPPQVQLKIDQRNFVSVGPPFPGVEIKIIENGHTCPAGKIGEIAIRSIANSPGYFLNSSATRSIIWEDGFLLSGDLGYLDKDGFLFIISRKKNIIKRAGQTISPQEIEEIVDQFKAVRYSAAVGIDKGRMEGEQIFVFVEIRAGSDKTIKEFQTLLIEIVNGINARMGFRPARVFLLNPHSIPLTHNGKIRHAHLKSNYLTGELRASGAILYPDY